VKAQNNDIRPINTTNSENGQSIKSHTPIAKGDTPICIGSKTELTLISSCAGTVNWKTSANDVVGKGSVLNISPKVTTNYIATCTVNGIESKPSNEVTVVVNSPKFNGLPITPANYEVTSSEPFYLGIKSTNSTPLRWKHESAIGNETQIKPVADLQTYYVRYEEPETGCVSAWKPVTVRLVNKNSVETPSISKKAKIAANTPASSCSSMASSSDAQLCSNTTFPALINNTTDGGTATTSWGCLRTRPNQSWFYFIPQAVLFHLQSVTLLELILMVQSGDLLIP
jgi:hypothetical protein